MATAKTMWVTEDGKSFDTKLDALAHEFAVKVMRDVKAVAPADASSPYSVLRWYFKRRELSQEQYPHLDKE